MGSTRRWFGFPCFPLVLAVLAVAGTPPAARARGGGWSVEVGLATRAVAGFGRLSGTMQPIGGGGDIDLHVVHDRGGLGARAVYGTSGLKKRSADLLTSSGNSVSCDLWQTIQWWAVGPSWSLPLGTGRVEAYAVGGMAWSSREVQPTSSSFWSDPPASSAVGFPGQRESPPTAIVLAGWVGASPRIQLWRFGLRVEAGAEVQLAGSGSFWETPAFVSAGGETVERTRRTPMNTAALRLGLDFVAWSGRR